MKQIKNRKCAKDEGTVISHMYLKDIKEQINSEMLNHWSSVADPVQSKRLEKLREEGPELETRKPISILRNTKRTNSSNCDLLVPQKADNLVSTDMHLTSLKYSTKRLSRGYHSRTCNHMAVLIISRKKWERPMGRNHSLNTLRYSSSHKGN